MAWLPGRVTVGTSKVALSTGGSKRCDIGIQIIASTGNATAVYIGPTTGVSASIGLPIGPGKTFYLPNAGASGIVADPAKIYAISTGTGRILYYALLGST